MLRPVDLQEKPHNLLLISLTVQSSSCDKTAGGGGVTGQEAQRQRRVLLPLPYSVEAVTQLERPEFDTEPVLKYGPAASPVAMCKSLVLSQLDSSSLLLNGSGILPNMLSGSQ